MSKLNRTVAYCHQLMDAFALEILKDAKSSNWPIIKRIQQIGNEGKALESSPKFAVLFDQGVSGSRAGSVLGGEVAPRVLYTGLEAETKITRDESNDSESDLG